jgi:hypothetical protein
LSENILTVGASAAHRQIRFQLIHWRHPIGQSHILDFAKLLKISSAICFGFDVLAAPAPLRHAQYIIIDGELLLDLEENGNGSKFGDLQAVSMVLAVAFLTSGYAAGRNHKLRTEVRHHGGVQCAV